MNYLLLTFDPSPSAANDKVRNPLTAKVAKYLRKDRKELIYIILTLRPLRRLCELCG
jgi:hypothetical protein